MKFTETTLSGAYLIDLTRMEDQRGFFARAWCEQEFARLGLKERMVQTNVSSNRTCGTLRGMHYQGPPYEEAKLVRCTRGALYDVIIDLRPESQTYLRWFGVELTGDNYRMLYVPERFAHGFQTLVDNTEAVYQVSQFYMAGAELGIRWNDPLFRIAWPLGVRVISEKDGGWPDFFPVAGNQPVTSGA
jgi:dTDP-4-dehydrorhamnose 3,5-epimerase